MSVINIESWTAENVSDWIAGLDTSLKGYGRNFVQKGIDGKRLLNLMAGDLLTIGIEKVGDQVLLADAIQSLRNELESDRVTLQTLASNVSVRSKNLRNFTARAKKNFVSNESLAAASFLIDAGKTLLRWLTRFPFLGVPIYNEITNKMGKHLFELAYICKRDSFADNAIEEVQYLCTKIIEICEHIINMKDSLTIQPAAVDVITIRKRHEQELGLQFESSYFGLHMVSGHTSPAQQSGHLERGDEILQVNYQTVIGWDQAALVHLLYENPCEVVLTVKRRPRHASTGLGHMYLRPSKLPGRNNSKSSPQSRKLGTGTIRANHPNPILEVEDDDDDGTSIIDHKTSTPDTLTVEANSGGGGYSAAETRFWKQYPKPRNLLKRRATVTGSSPTSTRPPVTFTSESSTSHQQKSSMSGSGSRHRLDKCISAPERNKLEKQDQIEETLRLFVGDSNVRGSRVTLPCVGSNNNNTITGGNLDFDSSSSSSSTVNTKSSNQQAHSSNNNNTITTTNTNKSTMAPIKSSLKIKENKKYPAELDDDVFEPPSTPPSIIPIVVTTCSRLSNVINTLTVVTPKSSTGTTTTTTTTSSNVTRETTNSPVSILKTTTNNEGSPNISTTNTPTPTTPTIINEVMKSKDSISVVTEVVKTSVPLSSIVTSSSSSTTLSNVPNSAIDNHNNHTETKLTTTTTSITASVKQEKKENTIENKNIIKPIQTNPAQIESKTIKTFNAFEKPQSLTNLVHQASIESNSSEKSELLHSGFLHQRQPHWKFGGPRWSRCRATVDSQYFRLIKPEMEILLNAYNFSLANEVHSRPFAFKIEDKKDKATVHYFAAESHAELSIWMVYLNIEGGESPRGFASRSSFLNRSMSVQPEVQRSYSTPSSEKMQRRSSLPHSQNLQYQFRKKLSKLQTASSYSSSTSSIMEDKLKFWNSSPTPMGSPTHHQYNSNSKSNISSITITSCKRNQQQQQEVPKSMNTKPLESSQRANLKTSTIIPTTNESDNATESSNNTTSTTRATLVKKPSLDSPTRKSRVSMGTSGLLLKKDRKSSDSQNNNEMSCGTCGRSLLNQHKSTQTEELVVIFNTTGESRI